MPFDSSFKVTSQYYSILLLQVNSPRTDSNRECYDRKTHAYWALWAVLAGENYRVLSLSLATHNQQGCSILLALSRYRHALLLLSLSLQTHNQQGRSILLALSLHTINRRALSESVLLSLTTHSRQARSIIAIIAGVLYFRKALRSLTIACRYPTSVSRFVCVNFATGAKGPLMISKGFSMKHLFTNLRPRSLAALCCHTKVILSRIWPADFGS